jgi:hypothetical protein
MVEVKAGQNRSLSKELIYFYEHIKPLHAFQINFSQDYVEVDSI